MAAGNTPTMEGVLEKQNSGVSRFLGKAKFWCTLQGTCLVYSKENKRSSVVESLFLSEAMMVRKTQGSQFEIVMKKQKTHIFTAASPAECTAWVKCLQQAMIQHEPSSQRSNTRRQLGSNHGYEEITLVDESRTNFSVSPLPRNQIPVLQSGIYADVADAVKVHTSTYNSSAGEYAEIDELIRPRQRPDKTESVVYRENSLYSRNKEREERETSTASKIDEDLANGYSTLDSCRDMAIKEQIEDMEEKEFKAEERKPTMPEYAKVNKATKSKKATCAATNPHMPPLEEGKVYEAEKEVREGAAIENLDQELKRLPVSSAPAPWSSLTADDRKPVEDLKDFLSNNRHLCRPSYTRMATDVDPLVKLKELLLEIG